MVDDPSYRIVKHRHTPRLLMHRLWLRRLALDFFFLLQRREFVFVPSFGGCLARDESFARDRPRYCQGDGATTFEERYPR